jgi:hypothetical protein
MKKCKSCQKEIDDKAKKCPYCQTDQRNWFVRHPIISFILIIIFLAAIGSSSGKNSGLSTNNQKVGTNKTNNQQQPTIVPTPIVIDAHTLVKEYDENKLAAQDKYTGKQIQTTAYITNISTDIVGNYFLSLKPTNEEYYFGTTFKCSFKNKDDLVSLKNGEKVTIRGIMRNMSLGIITMDDCQVVK